MDGRTEARLRELIDRQDILDVLLRLARGLDRLDRALVRDSYWDDAIDDHQIFVGDPDAFADWALAHAEATAEAQHHGLGNHLCEIDGDDAHAETHFTFLAVNRAPPHLLSMGRYVDHLQRREGIWKIANRVTLIEGTFDLAENANSALVRAGDTRHGPILAATRDRNDPSYRRPIVPRRPGALD